MRTIERDIVSAVLISKDGKILQALQTPDGRGAYPGCWGIIGGGVDEGESFREALDREIKEETGIDISAYDAELITEDSGESSKTLKNTGERVWCKMKFFTYKVVMHNKDAEQIPVILDEEHSEYRWTKIEELKNLKLTPPSERLFSKLGYIK